MNLIFFFDDIFKKVFAKTNFYGILKAEKTKIATEVIL